MSKKEEMLLSALELFASEGYENVGIQKIVRSVKVTKPTLYHYFGSKQGLLEALLEHYFAPFISELETKSVYNGDLTSSLESLVKSYFHFVLRSKDFYRFSLSLMYSSEQSEARKTIHPFIQKQYALIEACFKGAEQDHGNMRGRSQRYALTFLGTINAYITGYFQDQMALSDETAFQSCKQFMHGIYS